MQETWVRSLGQENPLEKEMATHSSVLAWEIPWTEEPGRFIVHGIEKIQTRLSDSTTENFFTAQWNKGVSWKKKKKKSWVLGSPPIKRSKGKVLHSCHLSPRCTAQGHVPSGKGLRVCEEMTSLSKSSHGLSTGWPLTLSIRPPDAVKPCSQMSSWTLGSWVSKPSKSEMYRGIPSLPQRPLLSAHSPRLDKRGEIFLDLVLRLVTLSPPGKWLPGPSPVPSPFWTGCVLGSGQGGYQG